MNPSAARQILVLGTGGTIAGTAGDPGDSVGYQAAQLGVDQLVAQVPQFGGLTLRAVQVAQVDSKDMDIAVWKALVRACLDGLADEANVGIVITHGTDTLEETAWLLHELLPAWMSAKPVVLTCAMRPATSRLADGPQNVLDALALALDSRARGVLVVSAGKIHAARHVQKVHPYRLDAFDSHDAGPLGYVEEGCVRWVNATESPTPQTVDAREDRRRLARLFLDASSVPRVEVVFSHAGADGAIVRALVADGVNGVIVAGTGNGTVHHALERELLAARARGVLVRRASRCAYGQVIGTARDAIADTAGLAPFKARIRMMLDLMQNEAGP